MNFTLLQDDNPKHGSKYSSRKLGKVENYESLEIFMPTDAL